MACRLGKGNLMFSGWLRKRITKFSALTVLVSVVLSLSGLMQSAQAQGGVLVGVDEARVVPLVSAPSTVIVGNPGIADYSRMG